MPDALLLFFRKSERLSVIERELWDRGKKLCLPRLNRKGEIERLGIKMVSDLEGEHNTTLRLLRMACHKARVFESFVSHPLAISVPPRNRLKQHE